MPVSTSGKARPGGGLPPGLIHAELVKFHQFLSLLLQERPERMTKSPQASLPSRAEINQALSAVGPFSWPEDENDLIALVQRILSELPRTK